jgi:hypothetical protein
MYSIESRPPFEGFGVYDFKSTIKKRAQMLLLNSLKDGPRILIISVAWAVIAAGTFLHSVEDKKVSSPEGVVLQRIHYSLIGLALLLTTLK